MSRRDAIKMSAKEIEDFLDEQRVVVVATNGKNGFPHLMPLWYVVRDGELWGWTYAKSQKVRNLERDGRATLQVEDGVQYHELRGVMIEAETIIHHDHETVEGIGLDLAERYSGTRPEGEMREAFSRQVPKRVGLQFKPLRIVTWDHRKLGGVY